MRRDPHPPERGVCHPEPRVPAKRADEGSSSSPERALAREDEDPSPAAQDDNGLGKNWVPEAVASSLGSLRFRHYANQRSDLRIIGGICVSCCSCRPQSCRDASADFAPNAYTPSP